MRRVKFSKLNTVFRSNRGTTMLETLMAFTVLMIVLLALFKMVSFSSRLRMRAEDTATVRETFNSNMYRSDINSTDAKTKYQIDHVDYTGISNGDTYTAFMLVFDEETTDESNYISGSDGKTLGKPITLSRIDATGYFSTDPLTSESNESIAVPKALRFRYYNGVFYKNTP